MSEQDHDMNGSQDDDQLNGGDYNGEKQNGHEDKGRDDDRKLFVGGLSWETTDKELQSHFGQYGDIESINVKTDPNTGRSRGFAFIVFACADAIDKVVAAGEHVINNKKVDPKKAKARHGKIFVGGLTTEISDDEIKAYFSQFGNIVEVEMPFDKQKNQRKGFCFITFDSEQVVNELLKTPKQKICDKEVDVKKATPKPDNMQMQMPMGLMRGSRGGPGGAHGSNMSGTGGPRGGRGGRAPGKNSYSQGGWGNQGYGSGGYYGQGYGGYDSYGGAGFDYYGGGYSGYGGYDYSGYGNYGKYNNNSSSSSSHYNNSHNNKHH